MTFLLKEILQTSKLKLFLEKLIQLNTYENLNLKNNLSTT